MFANDENISGNVDLRKIKDVAPKGRVQDKYYNQNLPEIDALIAIGNSSIPFLLNKIEDETVIDNHVFDYWPSVHVGDVAIVILTNFFLDSKWEHSTVPGMGWDEVLDRKNNQEATGDELLEKFIAKNGRIGLRQKIEKILAPYDNQFLWDENERCFKPIK